MPARLSSFSFPKNVRLAKSVAKIIPTSPLKFYSFFNASRPAEFGGGKLVIQLNPSDPIETLMAGVSKKKYLLIFMPK
jgi:hypothetical protein